MEVAGRARGEASVRHLALLAHRGRTLTRVAAIDDLLAEVRARLPRRALPSELDDVRARAAASSSTPARWACAMRTVPSSARSSSIATSSKWRLDPTCAHRLPEVTGLDQEIVVVCDEGYASSLAADTLQRIGLRNATDLEGGFQAWKAFSRQ